MASPERLPPAYRFEVGVNALILNKIYNLPLRNPDESGKIRNPSATKNKVTQSYIALFCKAIRAAAAGPLVVCRHEARRTG